MPLSFLTSNRNKFEEAKEIASSFGVEVRWVPHEYEEARGESCEDVVRKTLEGFRPPVDPPFFIEDSGLFIEALGGFPGPYSAFVFKRIGYEGILRLMKGITDRRAYFECVIGLVDDDGVHVFKGRVDGFISESARGKSGFGYDPIFIPKGYKFTFAENKTLKGEVSHRREALVRMFEYIGGRYGQDAY